MAKTQRIRPIAIDSKDWTSVVVDDFMDDLKEAIQPAILKAASEIVEVGMERAVLSFSIMRRTDEQSAAQEKDSLLRLELSNVGNEAYHDHTAEYTLDLRDALDMELDSYPHSGSKHRESDKRNLLRLAEMFRAMAAEIESVVSKPDHWDR